MSQSLRIQLGIAIATGQLHPDASREIMIWLGCYQFFDAPATEFTLHMAVAGYHHETMLRNKEQEAGRWISGYDPYPWSYAFNVAKILGCLGSYFTADDQIVIAKEIIKKK